MVKHYSGNAIYNFINAKKLQNYLTFAEKEWLLLYGSSDCIPKLMAYVIEIDSLSDEISDKNKRNGNLSFRFAQKVGIPIVIVRFVANDDTLQVYWKNNWKVTTYSGLADIFNQFGLLKDGDTGKDVNRYLSSRYHKWQRETLGAIIVSDFDLLELDESGNVIKLFELKRSYIDIEEWRPFEADYNNFSLLTNLLLQTDVDFYIIYNQFKDKVDYIDKVALFEVEKGGQNPVTASNFKYIQNGIFPIEEIIK